MKTSVLTLVLVALSLVFSPALAQKNCSKGRPCGNTCISMSYTCRVGSGSSGSSSSSGSDYNSSSGSTTSTDYDDTIPSSRTAEPSSMSGGASLPASELSGSDIVEFYTGLPTPQAYSRIKGLLEVGSFTEDVNVMYADGLTVEFSENSSGMAVLRMQGSNTDLMSEIEAVFN